MFALSYTGRCLVCRAAFVACCVVPTMSMLLYAGWLKLPGHVIHHQRCLERQLRMSVTLEGVEPIEPGRAMLHSIAMAERTSGHWLARVPQLETGASGATRVLIARHVDLHGNIWQHLVHLLDDHAASGVNTVLFSASRVNWHAGDEVVQLEQLSARLEQGETGPVCEVRFRLNDRRATEPVRFMLARLRDGQRQLTGYEIDTGEAHLPCLLALPALPWIDCLGPRAQFSGQAIIYHSDDGWQGELRGQLHGVDLRRLVSQPLGHELHGLAELNIERARFDSSRLTDANGTLLAGPGMIGPSLRQSAMRWLTRIASPAAQSAELLPYEELAFDFTISSSGLKIAGACTQGPPGTLLGDRRQPLLATSPQGDQFPLANLIQTLAPASEEQVPVSRTTGWLLKVLPTP